MTILAAEFFGDGRTQLGSNQFQHHDMFLRDGSGLVAEGYQNAVLMSTKDDGDAGNRA